MQIRKMAFHNAIALFFHEPSSANVEPSRLKFPVGPSENVEGHLFNYSQRPGVVPTSKWVDLITQGFFLRR